MSLAAEQYHIEPRTKRYVRRYGQKIQKQLLDTGLDSFKTASKKVVHKTGEF